MSQLSILPKDSALVPQYQAYSNQPGTINQDWIIFSWDTSMPVWGDLTDVVEQVCSPVSLYATIDAEGNEITPAFDFAATEPQELSSAAWLALVASDAVRFPPIVEPAPEPRYKEYMTQAEFIRNLITEAEWAAIAPLAQADPTVWAWCYTTNAGDVWVKHPSFEVGVQMGIDTSVWDAARADEIRKGLLIV